ncbi:MAG TPA: hypothetical protein VH165_12885 [Kofleriaceae bacterium]|jgi:hypothetical protein|nr:hypothetical protein [Kofleriaceae bacterium]
MRGALVLLLLAPLSATAAPAGRNRGRTKPAPAEPATATAVQPTGTYVPATPQVAAGSPHREGEYGGVTPGEPPASDARPRAKHPPPKGTLTWIGFTAKDGGAEVFFQSVAPFTLSQHVEGASLVVHLGLPRLGHNTWRRIDTRFFDNPLSGIVARAVGAARATKDRPAHGAGVEARISFKNARDAHEATVRTATETDGMYYTYLAFGEGSDAPAAGAPATPTLEDPEVAPDDAPVDPPAAPAKP